ncbi:Uncharacterised protein [Enterobacter hormaechei]|nr:hypothetical protein AN2364V1_0498 [Enterobacter cloacae]CAH6177956.1 hypothetical protein AN2364V1_0498 [Enterobacter cloacae]SAA81739.1 Uncharacterised protein [Enterobacter hormaechei]VAL27651.1 Uncharacterised protein [Enterobacter hormaechei]VAL81037.1 Uncharacterised protein [Enterobacter hormaechei]
MNLKVIRTLITTLEDCGNQLYIPAQKPDLKGLIYITQSLILKQVKKYTQVNPVFGHMTEKGMNNILLMVYCGGAKIMTKINLD